LQYNLCMKEEDQNYTQYRIKIPAKYEDVFSHLYYAHNHSSETVTKTLLPSYQTILIFCFNASSYLHSKEGTKIKVDHCLMIGPVKRAFDYSLLPDAAILTVNFIDDAFYRFFGSSLIADHLPFDPDEILNEDCFNTLWGELNQISDVNKKVQHILQFCDPYLLHRNQIAEQLSKFNDIHLNPIKSVALQHTQTERNIQINHKKHFGYSCKELSRYQRFLKAVNMVQEHISSQTKTDWFQVIEQCGYYDQSQLIHDFRHYTNLTPTKYLKFQKEICNPIS